MICFVPPIPASRDDSPSPPPSQPGTTTSIVLILLIAFCMLILPFGWSASKTRDLPVAPPSAVR